MVKIVEKGDNKQTIYEKDDFEIYDNHIFWSNKEGKFIVYIYLTGIGWIDLTNVIEITYETKKGIKKGIKKMVNITC